MEEHTKGSLVHAKFPVVGAEMWVWDPYTVFIIQLFQISCTAGRRDALTNVKFGVE